MNLSRGDYLIEFDEMPIYWDEKHYRLVNVEIKEDGKFILIDSYNADDECYKSDWFPISTIKKIERVYKIKKENQSR